MHKTTASTAAQGTFSSIVTDLRRCRLLYIEDHADTAWILEKYLRRQLDLDVVVADTLMEAVDLLQTAPDFDMVLTDLRLPDGNGLDLLDRARAAGIEVTIPVLSFSASASPADHAASRAAGFAEHVCKPVDLQDLTRIILRHLPDDCAN